MRNNDMKLLIGINVPKHPDADALEGVLERIAGDGFDTAEYCLSNLPLIIGGAVCRRYVDYIKPVFKKSPLTFTAHIGAGLNLRKTEEFALHKQVLLSSIDICEALEMRVLTVHFEEQSLHLDVEQRFMQAHLEAAEYAMKKGVLLCIENIETDHYTHVLDFVKKANHPNLKMTLDLGHLNLSTHFFGQDFLTAVEACAPYARHLHISDNTGRFERMRLENFALYSTLERCPRIAFGSGDIHIPPFWGTIDLAGAFSLLQKAGYAGTFLCEYYSYLFTPFNSEIQRNVRGKLQELFCG